MEAAEIAFANLAPERRYEFILRVASVLTIDEKKILVGEVAIQVEEKTDEKEPVPEKKKRVATKAEPKKPPQSKSEPSSVPPREGKGTYVDQAEEFVLSHPEGVTTTEVAEAIVQPPNNADGTLRQVMKTRKTIERRDDKWWPATTPKVETGRRTIRTTIVEVFVAAGGASLDASEIWQGLLKIQPEIKKASVENELNRMRKEKLLRPDGPGRNKGSAYRYYPPNGGAHAAA
jgi:hypothetical protein